MEILLSNSATPSMIYKKCTEFYTLTLPALSFHFDIYLTGFDLFTVNNYTGEIFMHFGIIQFVSVAGNIIEELLKRSFGIAD